MTIRQTYMTEKWVKYWKLRWNVTRRKSRPWGTPAATVRQTFPLVTLGLGLALKKVRLVEKTTALVYFLVHFWLIHFQCCPSGSGADVTSCSSDCWSVTSSKCEIFSGTISASFIKAKASGEGKSLWPHEQLTCWRSWKARFINPHQDKSSSGFDANFPYYPPLP